RGAGMIAGDGMSGMMGMMGMPGAMGRMEGMMGAGRSGMMGRGMTNPGAMGMGMINEMSPVEDEEGSSEPAEDSEGSLAAPGSDSNAGGEATDTLPGTDPASKAIKAKLDEPIPMSFDKEPPLGDVLLYIRQATSGDVF